jgi:acetolactate synthase-1/2/3 large subunit
MGGWSERVDDPSEIASSIVRAKRATEDGQAALLEFITAKDPRASHADAFS